MTEQMTDYLRPTEFIESQAPEILAISREATRTTPAETAVALFDWVRDNVVYDVRCAADPPESYHATAVLARRRGYCVQKAVLLAALGRSAGIPTRLGFADVRNHKLPDSMRVLMGTNLFVYHGFVEFFLGGKWVKATPAFDQETSRKAGVLPVVLDGTNDAMLHPVDPEGHPYIEYLRNRGTYADLPLEEIQTTFLDVYAQAAKVLLGS